MTTRAKIKQELQKITTHLYDKGKPAVMLNVSQFGSFVDNNCPLPSNREMITRAKERNVKLTATKIGGTDVEKEKKINKDTVLFSDTDLRLTEKERDQQPLNRYVMFVAENMAARPDPKAAHGGFFSMFHDLTRPTNTYKLYTQLNDSRFRGAYITDLIKNTEESDSGHVDIAFLIGPKEEKSILHWQDNLKQNIARLMKVRKRKKTTYQIAETETEARDILKANAATFRTSAAIFAQECHVIKPEHLVIFGSSAAKALRQMKPLFAGDSFMLSLYDKIVVTTHYAYVNRGGLAALAKKQPAELLDQLKKIDENKVIQ